MRVQAIICGRRIVRTAIPNIAEVVADTGWEVDTDTAMRCIAKQLNTTHSGTKLLGAFESCVVQNAMEDSKTR